MGKLLLLLLTLTSSYSSRITVDPDGGYRNIVVKIADTVAEDLCFTYIQNLKEMLTEASGVLAESLGESVYLKQVTVVVPSFWRDARCHMAIANPPRGVHYQVGDVIVTNDSPVFGSAPFTEQSRGCGLPGDRILLPQSFLAAWNKTATAWGSPGRLFVREWAKFRYGIFDEQGYVEDPLYPNFYKFQDRLLPTGTSNAVVLGAWLHQNGTDGCEPTSGACYYDPEGENDQVTCSLGYAQYLPRVTRWCAQSDLTMPLAPTKHNILCGAKSALDVITEHADFSQLSGERQLQRSLAPTFTIVREPLPQYVLMIETSAAMADIWKWVRKAAQNLIRYEVPESGQMAVVTFSGEARLEHKLTPLTTESVRSRMADTIPDSPNKLGQTAEGCVSCGVQVVMDQVLRNREAGGHLIIISKKTDQGSISETQLGNIESIADSFGLRVSSVLITEGSGGLDDSEDSGLQRLASRSGGGSYRVSRSGPVLAMYSDLVEAMRNLIALDTKDLANHPLTVYRQLVSRTDSEPSLGSFTVDASLGRQTEFGVYVEDDEDHQIKSVEFTDAEGNAYGPFTKMSSTYDVVNFKTINFNVGEEPPFDDAQKRGTAWQYKIEWYDINDRRDNVVTVRSKPSEVASSGLVKVDTWTNMPDAAAIALTPDRLLAIFVKVTRGESPVLGARVLVDLTVLLTNGTRIHQEAILLLDNGYGEPDLVSGDGVYSRFITRYPGPGKYSYMVHVNDNNLNAMTVTAGAPTVFKPLKLGPPTCCGSRIPVPANRKQRIGPFERQLAGGPPLLLTSVPPAGEDIIRPGKIGDLQLSPLRDRQQLLAKWTAPGGDFNDGPVMTYRFVFSQKIEELLTPSLNAPALDGLKRTDTPGQSVSYVINFKYYGQDYYVGLYAFDEAGNRGNMSNIVIVNVPPPPVEPTEPGAMEPIVLKSPTDWTMIGAIIGAVGVLLLVLIVGLYCHFCRKKSAAGGSKFSKAAFARDLRVNGKSGGVISGGGGGKGVKVEIPSPPESEQTDSSSYESDLKGSNSSNHLVGAVLPPHGRLQQQPPAKMSSTSFGNNITPTYWSASQLLSEHEQRKRSGDERDDGRQPEDDYRDLIIGGGGGFTSGVGGGEEEYSHQVINYDPGSNYGYYADNYNYDSYYDQYDPRQRYSTSSLDPGFGVYGYGGPGHGISRTPDYGVINKSSQKLVGNSDISSSTLGMANPSLQGSQLSLNSSARLPKNRNITQV